VFAGVAALAALALGGAAIAGAAGQDKAGAEGEEASEQVAGADATRAKAAALAKVGGGKANSVERDSEKDAVYEVEVTKTDGTTVDVRLDQRFAAVAVESDTESGENEAGESKEDAEK